MNRRGFLRLSASAVGGAVCSIASPAIGQARRPMRDIVVLIPGIMGSVLQKEGRDLWALSGSGLLNALTTLGRSVTDLRLTRDSPDADDLGDGVVASRIFPDTHLLPGLWKIDGYTQISQALTAEFDLRPGDNYFEFPYDWRRDNRVAARRLSRLVPQWLKAWRQKSGYANARVIVLAHSMGGLVARYFVEVLGGWSDVRMLITFGTPFRGSLNAVNMLSNGLQQSFGPFGSVDISGLVRSFTSVYQLLPIYPCYDTGDGRLRSLSAAASPPNIDTQRLTTALAFHDQIRQANEQNAKNPAYLSSRYSLHPIVGTYQRTFQVARRAGGLVQMSDRHPQADVRGDGTVPQESATPIEPDALMKQHRTVYVAEVHGSLQNSRVVLDHVLALLAQADVRADLFRESRVNAVALTTDDLYSTEQSVRISVGCENPDTVVIVSVMESQSGREVQRIALDRVSQAAQDVDCGRLAEGSYRVRASTATGGSATDVFVVMRP